MAIDRKEFLLMCQKASILQYKDIPSDLLVVFDETKYFPFGYQMKFENGVPVHTAMLLDFNRNSLVLAKLERIDKN